MLSNFRFLKVAAVVVVMLFFVSSILYSDRVLADVISSQRASSGDANEFPQKVVDAKQLDYELIKNKLKKLGFSESLSKQKLSTLNETQIKNLAEKINQIGKGGDADDVWEHIQLIGAIIVLAALVYLLILIKSASPDNE